MRTVSTYAAQKFILHSADGMRGQLCICLVRSMLWLCVRRLFFFRREERVDETELFVCGVDKGHSRIVSAACGINTGHFLENSMNRSGGATDIKVFERILMIPVQRERPRGRGQKTECESQQNDDYRTPHAVTII